MKTQVKAKSFKTTNLKLRDICVLKGLVFFFFFNYVIFKGSLKEFYSSFE